MPKYIRPIAKFHKGRAKFDKISLNPMKGVFEKIRILNFYRTAGIKIPIRETFFYNF